MFSFCFGDKNWTCSVAIKWTDRNVTLGNTQKPEAQSVCSRWQKCVRKERPVESTCQTPDQVAPLSQIHSRVALRPLPSRRAGRRRFYVSAVCYWLLSDPRVSTMWACASGDLPKVTKCVVGAPLTQGSPLVVVSGVTGMHSNANAAYKYTSTSRLFKT